MRRRCCPTARSSIGPAGLSRRCWPDPIGWCRRVTEKLLTYALGRGLEYYDVPGGPRDRARGGRQRLSFHFVADPGRREERAVSDEENRRHDHHQDGAAARTFLRGMGATLALPLLDAMVPALSAHGDDAGRRRPRRLGFVYLPNGVAMNFSGINYWKPTERGRELRAVADPDAARAVPRSDGRRQRPDPASGRRARTTARTAITRAARARG